MSKEYYKKKIIDLRKDLEKAKEAKKKDNERYASLIKSATTPTSKASYRKRKIDASASHDRKIESMQNVILENRGRLNISGVNDVLNFDENTVNVNTELGLLCIKGYDLKLNRLNLDNTELLVEGTISSLAYSDSHQKGSFIQKLFK